MSTVMNGAILFLLLLLTSVAYERMETSHFAILYQAGDRKIAKGLLRSAEPTRSRIMADLGANFPDKTEIFIAPTIEDFQHLQPGGTWVPLWAGGVAYPERNLIIMRSPRSVKRGHMDYLQVFAHEFTHVALGRAITEGEVPPWLAEGLAMYEAGEWSFERSATVVKAVLSGRLIPLHALSFPADEEEAELSYAESFIFVSFLINHMGRSDFHRFIRDYSRSSDLEGSLRRATGMSMAEVEQQWLLYLKLRVSWVPVVTSATTLWFIVALIFLYGYLRKRALATRRMRQWEEDEAHMDGDTRNL